MTLDLDALEALCADAKRVGLGTVILGCDDALALIERARRAQDGFRYILGYDIAGYDAHLRPEEVARRYLEETP